MCQALMLVLPLYLCGLICQHYVVATQDVKLINSLRRIAGVPILQVTGRNSKFQ